MKTESGLDYLERVKVRAKELYAMSDQGEWDDLEVWIQERWINAADKDLKESGKGPGLAVE